MRRSRLAFAAIALIATLMARQPKAMALGDVSASEEASTLMWREILVRNIAPRIMAWWIDPAHQAEPIEFLNSRRSMSSGAANADSISARESELSKLPEGVESLVAVDNRSIILVLATEAGAERMRTIVALLDKPLIQIEIEAQFVRLSARDAKIFRIGVENKTAATKPAQVSVSTVSRDFKAKLQGLVLQKKAQVIFSPHITTFNNLTAEMSSRSGVPAVIGVKNKAGFAQMSEKTLIDTRFTVSSGLSLTVTPTVNRDGTLTLALIPAFTTTLDIQGAKIPEAAQSAKFPATPAQSFPLKQSPALNVIANMPDGDTLAISGLSLESLPNFASQPKAPQSQLIVFVTARIVKRTEEPEPGT